MRILEKTEDLPAWAAPALLFVIALVFRLGYVFWSGSGAVPDPDSAEYLNYADNLLAGRGYIDGQWRAFRAPGYSFFVAGVFYLFGKSIPALKIVQSLLSSLVPVMVYFIGLRVCGRRAALLAGLFACFYFGLVFEPYHILTEVLFTPLFALSVLLLLKTKDDWKYALAAGAALSLTALTRPVGMLAVAAAFLWLFLMYPVKRALKTSALVALAGCAVMAPWWVRNYDIFGVFVPVCLETGVVLKSTHMPIEMHDFKDHLPELERDRQNLKDGLDYIRTQEPLPFLKKRFVEFFRFLHPFLPGYDLTYAFIIPFFLYGVYFVMKSRNTEASLLFSMFVYFPVAFAFCGSARFRHSLSPFFILLAAIGAEAIWRRTEGDPARARKAVRALYAWTAANILIFFCPGPVRSVLKFLAGT